MMSPQEMKNIEIYGETRRIYESGKQYSFPETILCVGFLRAPNNVWLRLRQFS